MPRLYGLVTSMAADLRADLDDREAREYLIWVLREELAGEGDGYQPDPDGEPGITWHQITETEAALKLSQLREDGYDGDDLPPGYAAGDWLIHVVTRTIPLR